MVIYRFISNSPNRASIFLLPDRVLNFHQVQPVSDGASGLPSKNSTGDAWNRLISLAERVVGSRECTSDNDPYFCGGSVFLSFKLRARLLVMTASFCERRLPSSAVELEFRIVLVYCQFWLDSGNIYSSTVACYKDGCAWSLGAGGAVDFSILAAR